LEARRFSAGGTGKEALAAADHSLSAMDRFENKILEHEAMAELTNESVARNSAADKAADDLEDELQALKAKAKEKK
jgi:phage shock protein A